MPLLYWAILTPQNNSSIAAVRFHAPVRLDSIAIFPTGVRPFAKAPEIVACTQPDAFFLELYLHVSTSSDAKDKQRVPNALEPTAIAYAGGEANYTIDMASEYATRFVVVKGGFEKVSMAFYGQVVSDIAVTVDRYEPRTLPMAKPYPLLRTIDPANSQDPTSLARQLLATIPDAPPLHLVIRLMFCIKPSPQDWESPDFPHLYVKLEDENEVDVDLQTVVSSLSRPVSDDASPESLAAFAERVSLMLGSKNAEQAPLVAELLSITASQHPEMARSLMHRLDLLDIFEVNSVTEDTILHLLDAVANIDVARVFNSESLIDILHDVEDSTKGDESMRLSVRRLLDRLDNWKLLEYALSHPCNDYVESINMLYDIGHEEKALGIWLESMIIHDDIATRLAANATSVEPLKLPSLLRKPTISMSRDEFVAFVRAYIGVACVLAVWAWADSLGNDQCREHTMAILHLWQNVDGYREIVNHLLLLRQLTRRLEWNVSENHPPAKSGILTEKVLAELPKDPQAILSEDLAAAVLALEPPLSFIAESDRLSLRKTAYVVEDGYPAAVEEIMFSSDHPLSLRRLRTLRASIAILDRELGHDQGEWRFLQDLGKEENSPALVPRLIELLSGVAGDLNGHFALYPPPKMNQVLADQLFCVADELLRLVLHLEKVIPLTTRGLRRLTAAVADIFACAYAAEMVYAQTSAAYISAQGIKKTCFHVLNRLCGPDSYAEPRKLGAYVVLQTLLGHAEDHAGRDPVHHLLQVFTLIDHVLPDLDVVHASDEDHSHEMTAHWISSVLPNMLEEFKAFFHLLDVENKVHFVKRLVKLDEGSIGIGEWLVMDELRLLLNSLENLASEMRSEKQTAVLRYQVATSLKMLSELIITSSSSSSWFIEAITSTPDVSHLLLMCLSALLELHYTTWDFRSFVATCVEFCGTFESDLKFAVAMSALRVAQVDPSLSRVIEQAVAVFENLSLLDGALWGRHADEVRVEIGQTLASFAEMDLNAPGGPTMDFKMAGEILSALEFLASRAQSQSPESDTCARMTILTCVKPDAFARLCQSMRDALPGDQGAKLQGLQSKFSVDEDERFRPKTLELPESLHLSLDEVEMLLRPWSMHPHRPQQGRQRSGSPVASSTSAPSTPKAGAKTPDILGLVISPPTAVLRAATTGLTKTYLNNDFRQLRQMPSARQNTSRLPSMHVDEFEVSPAPLAVPDPTTETYTGMVNIM